MDKVLHVEGMMCQNCARHVTEALEQAPGEFGVDVNLGAGTVSVSLSGNVDEGPLRSAVEDAGYDFKGIETA